MRISRAMAVLRCPLESECHLSNTGSSISVTCGATACSMLSIDGNQCWGAPRQAVSPPWCFTFPVFIQSLRTQLTPPLNVHEREQSKEGAPSTMLNVPTQ